VSDIPQWMLVEFMPGNWAADNPPEIVKNWARFRIGGRGSTTSCFSLESRYRSPQHWHPTQTIVPIDLALAVLTEESWRAIPSHKHKFVLCWHWVYAWSRGHICKHLRQHGMPIELSEYDEVLTAAMASFCMELQKKTDREVVNDAHRIQHNSPVESKALEKDGHMRELQRAEKNRVGEHFGAVFA
jgi:transcriptional antiterminator Rof (Rho-off)